MVEVHLYLPKELDIVNKASGRCFLIPHLYSIFKRRLEIENRVEN